MKIALVGNPNTGKSSVFNMLTGMRQHVGNFPGVTVDKKFGTIIETKKVKLRNKCLKLFNRRKTLFQLNIKKSS